MCEGLEELWVSPDIPGQARALSQTFPFPLIVAFLNISNYTKLHTFPFHHYMVE